MYALCTGVRQADQWKSPPRGQAQVARYLRHVTLNLYTNVSRLRFHAFLEDTCEHREEEAEAEAEDEDDGEEGDEEDNAEC